MRKLDTIVKEALIQRGYPIHYYLDFLAFAKDCLQELNFDTLKTCRSIKVEVTPWGAIELPEDCADVIQLGFIANGKMKTWLHDESIPLYMPVDENGVRVPFDSDYDRQFFSSDSLSANQNGESLGREFSHGAGVTPYRYRHFYNRNEIQLACLPEDDLYLDYITDGMTLEASNKIHPYAERSIKLFIDWQLKLKQSRFTEYERQKAEDMYYNELRKLRARLNPLTVEDIIQISREGLIAIPKS